MSQTSNEQFITQLESILGAREKQYAREMVTKLGIENADDLSEVDDKLLEFWSIFEEFHQFISCF